MVVVSASTVVLVKVCDVNTIDTDCTPFSLVMVVPENLQNRILLTLVYFIIYNLHSIPNLNILTWFICGSK